MFRPIVSPPGGHLEARASGRSRPWVAVGLLFVALIGSRAPAVAGAQSGLAPLSHWRALVIGIDRYPGSAGAPGAVADAGDLATALRGRGAAGVQLLTGGQATRTAVLAAMDELSAGAGQGDDILLAFDGLGLRDDQPAVATLAMTLLLAGADKARPDVAHALSGADLTRFVRTVEARGGRVLLVADAAFGGRVPRQQTSPSIAASGAATAVDDPAIDGGLAGPSGESLFDRSVVLSASDLRFGSDSVPLPGRPSKGRLLTYATARAIEGPLGADVGAMTTSLRLVSYAARVVYQLSAQRQQIAAIFGRSGEDPGASLDRRARGIVIKPTATLGAQPPELPAGPAPAGKGPENTLFPHANQTQAAPIRIAAATGSSDRLSKLLSSNAMAQAVPRSEDPDLIWDPAFKNVLTPAGDLVADDVDQKNIAAIIDRTLALRDLKGLIVDAPQQVVLLPDDEVKPRGSIVKIEVGDAAGRSLVLFNIRSDGKVQLLYPRQNDPPVITDTRYVLPLRIGDPIGADAIVAVTGSQRLVELEQGLAALNGQKRPVAAIKLIHDTALPGTLVGSVAIYSGRP